MAHELKSALKAFVESRIIEATKKDIANKAIIISKSLGKPIIAQYDDYSPLFETSFEDEEEFPTGDCYEKEIGYFFNGLYYGINLEITCMKYTDKKMAEIKITWNGYPVFLETDNKIEGYAPHKSWEDKFEMFYEAALDRDRKSKIKLAESEKEKSKSLFAKMIKEFKMLWGY